MRPATAALRGDLAALILAHSRYPRLGRVTTLNAARSGSLRCMRYAHMHGARWHPRTTLVAARGHLACLEYAVFNGAPWHPNTMEIAAMGYLQCLRFCHASGARWSINCTHSAALSSHVPCLKFAVENGAPRHELVIETSVRNVMDNPESESCRDTLTFAVDAHFPYSPSNDPRLANEVALVMEVRRQLHQVRVIQRAWRARPALVRARLAAEQRKRKAADVIQLAYLTWTLRPCAGASYKRARADWQLLSDAHSDK